MLSNFSGQSHFSENNVKLTEKNEFVIHFLQECLELRENKQNGVLVYVGRKLCINGYYFIFLAFTNVCSVTELT